MLKLLLPHPAAIIKTGKTKNLVIADPHIGWEMALRDKGIHVPSQTPKLLQKVTAVLSKYKPDTLLILGDVKYSVVATGPGEWHDIPDFFSDLKNYVTTMQILNPCCLKK
jgi:metallophosphoesterase superfamily enzyme